MGDIVDKMDFIRRLQSEFPPSEAVLAITTEAHERLMTLPMPARLFVASVLSWFVIMHVIGLIGTIGVLVRYPQPPPAPKRSAKDVDLPGITVLRPLKGLDANLRENLESVLNQDYPEEKLQVIFCVADTRDAAYPLAKELASAHPNVAEVHVGELKGGKNPKVRNLAIPFRLAKFDTIWTADSNVMLPDRGTMLRAASAMMDGAGLVHHLPVGVVPNGPCASGALLEAAFLGTAHAKMYTFFNTLGFASCVIGKSHLYSREALARYTGGLGIEAFKDNLAEDNSVAKMLWNGGHRLVIFGSLLDLLSDISSYLTSHSMPPDLALQHLSPSMKFKDYWNRRLRWIRIRKRAEPAATVLEPLTESLLLGCLVGLAVFILGFSPVPLLAFHYGIWLVSDLIIAVKLGLPLARLLPAYFARELFALPLWIAGVVGSGIDWRGERFLVGKGGEAVPIPKKGVGKEDSGVGLDEIHENGIAAAAEGETETEADGGIKSRLRKR